jgi:enolase
VDWSPEVTQIFVDILRDENVPEEFIDVFVESLETIGLIRYEDGMSRPAWDEFVRWTERFSES